MTDYIDTLKSEYTAESGKALAATIRNSIITMIILLLIGIAIAAYMGKRITTPIKLATSQMVRMSNNDFSDNKEMNSVRALPARENNEIGQIAKALDLMHNNIRALMLKISDTTSYVASASEELSSSASQSATKVKGTVPMSQALRHDIKVKGTVPMSQALRHDIRTVPLTSVPLTSWRS